MKKIVICGGHLAPALPVIECLKRTNKYDLYYIGRIKAMEGDKSESLEYMAIDKIGIPFINLICGRLQRSITRYTLLSLIKFPVSIIQSLIILQKLKPDLTVSFGSYVALPVCLASWILKIPVILHEQTHIMGLTNRIISRIAVKVCISYAGTAQIPDNIHFEVTGNPNLFEISSDGDKSLVNFGNKKLPLIYITGGSLGSHNINITVEKSINTLISKYRILHQTGKSYNAIDFNNLAKLRETINSPLRNNYQIVPYIDPSSTKYIYEKAALLIARAGANTVSEIQYFAVPSILIPLPHAAGNEQLVNANILAQFGGAIVLEEINMTYQSLILSINEIFLNWRIYKKKALQAKSSIQMNATSRITEIIEASL